MLTWQEIPLLRSYSTCEIYKAYMNIISVLEIIPVHLYIITSYRVQISTLHIYIFVVLKPAVSQSDCYVSLRLPSSSFNTARTKTISNCRNPVWNETFFFRIQNMAKVRSQRLFFPSKMLFCVYIGDRWEFHSHNI